MSNRWFTGRMLTVALLFGLSVMQPMASSAVQALNPGAGDKPHLDKLVGAWNVEIPPQNMPAKAIPALLVFTSDGIVIGARPPHPFETPAMGTWVSTGPKSAAFTFNAIFGSEKGEFTGKIKVLGTIQYDAGTDSWSASNYADFTDPSGHTVFTDTGTLKGTRLAVEAPPK